MNVHFLFSTRTWRKGICLLVTGAHVGVFAGPAQTPLLTASSGPKPNIVLTLDDSGSMNWHMMPTEVGIEALYNFVAASSYTEVTYRQKTSFSSTTTRNRCQSYFSINRNNPIITPPASNAPPTTYPGINLTNIRSSCYDSSSRSVPIPARYDRGTSSYQFYPRIHPSDHDGNGRNYSGVVLSGLTGFNSVENIFGARFRSADINGNYYNPDVEYKPWPAGVRNIDSTLINSDGSIADLTRAPLYPEGAPDNASTTTADLVNDVTLTTRWCASGMTSSGTYAMAIVDVRNGDDEYYCPRVSATFSPAVYFKKVSGNGTSMSHFQRVNINSSTDIPNAEVWAFQKRNFAIWFTYYRNRILTAKGATGLAFDSQKNNLFRLGYGSINARRNSNGTYSTGTVDEYTTAFALKAGVRAFNTDSRGTFMNWLRDLNANGGTPLRQSMRDIGEYYSTDGPYRTDPSNQDSTALSCRRNYHVMVTDGYWNDSSDSISDTIGNADYNAGVTHTSSQIKRSDGTAFSYSYSRRVPYQDSATTASKTLADVAMHYWKNDLRPGTDGLDNNIPITPESVSSPHNKDSNPAFWQHMVNFTVGLGVSGTVDLSTDITASTFRWPTPASNDPTTIDDLWHAAVNSRGKYLSARDPIAFAKSLSTILSSITTTGGTVSGVAVSRSSLGDNTLKFEPSFEPNKWSGELSAIQLNADTGAETSTVSWLASHKVPTYANRNIWMAISSTSAAEFTRSELGTTLPLGHIRSEGNTGVAPTINDALVNYLRGDPSGEGPQGFRPRATVTVQVDGQDAIRTNVLGTMMNSVPRFVKGADFGNRFLPTEVNSNPTGSSSYNIFLGTKRARAGMVLIGANDGMLHGFRASDGVELFGFIPKAVLAGESHPNSSIPDTTPSNLYGLARLADPNYEHQLYVDGQLAEGDVYACSGGNCAWKNIVLASTGGGAKSVFALDITQNFSTDSATEPSFFGASNFLWEYGPADDDLGYVMSPPEIGMLPSGKWVAVFGNGYDSVNGKAVLIMVDAVTGALVKKIEAGSGRGNGLGGVRLVRGLDNLIRHAYAGDLKGNVWKFDMTNEEVDLGGLPLFTAEHDDVAQPIMATPNYALHPSKGLMVIVPTGKLYDTDDQNGGTQQTIYGLWDKAPIGSASTSENAIDTDKLIGKAVQGSGNNFSIVADGTAPTSSRGWKLRMLNATGERGIYMPLFLGNGYTYVETVKPGQLDNESCSIAEGSGYGYLINVVSGAQAPKAIVDISGDREINESDAYGVFKRKNVSRGTVLSGLPGKSGSIQGDNSTGSKTDPLAEESSRYWRQIFWTIR